MRIRRTLLFIPGNNPAMLINGTVFGADSVIYDLEDAVSFGEKDAARFLVEEALKSLPPSQVERIVRINSLETPFWEKDLEAVVPQRPDAILLPKAETGEGIKKLAGYLTQMEKDLGIEPGRIKIIALVESALGIEKALEIALADPRVEALFLGAEDLTADLGARRSKTGEEILYSRCRVVTAARAAKIAAIDTPFTDVDDEEGLVKDSITARNLGFSGKAVISPRHIPFVNRVFTPKEAEVKQAQRIVAASEKAREEGKGVISLDGKMVDAPIVNRAKQILALMAQIAENEGGMRG
jgi:citrate lyase subunit beta/citryl-CoA lyase